MAVFKLSVKLALLIKICYNSLNLNIEKEEKMINGFKVIPKIQSAFKDVLAGNEFYQREKNLLFFSFNGSKKLFRSIRLANSILKNFFKQDFSVIKIKNIFLFFQIQKKLF